MRGKRQHALDGVKGGVKGTPRHRQQPVIDRLGNLAGKIPGGGGQLRHTPVIF